ncbi:MAG TPA: hypothetical protein VIG34_06395 [Xanthobacteraceae bacterium]|jgi:hypothetical protein
MRAARNLLLATTLSLGLAGCETGLDLLDKLDFMSSQKKPIVGERRAVFPTGVPGIDTNPAPAQPTNTNVPLSMAPQVPATQPEATPGKPAPRAPRTAQQPKNPADAWDGTR